MMTKVLAMILIFLAATLPAQSDSVLFDRNFSFRNGIYSSFGEMLQNSPKQPSSQLELRDGPLRTKAIYYYDKNSARLRYEGDVFAIVQNGRMSIGFDGNFHKLILLGSASTFFIEQPTVHVASATPGTMGAYQYTPDTRLYVLDLKVGKLGILDYDATCEILQRDSVLYTKFMKIPSKRKRKKMLYAYIMEYNNRNPTYIKK